MGRSNARIPSPETFQSIKMCEGNLSACCCALSLRRCLHRTLQPAPASFRSSRCESDRVGRQASRYSATLTFDRSPHCRSLQPLLTVQTYPEWARNISYRMLSCSAAFSSVSHPVVMPGTNALHASPSRIALPAGSCASIVTKAWVIFWTNAGSMSLCAVKQQ